MKYIVIEAPTLTDKEADKLQGFFYTITEAFAEHYFDQTERYHLNLTLRKKGYPTCEPWIFCDEALEDDKNPPF